MRGKSNLEKRELERWRRVRKRWKRKVLSDAKDLVEGGSQEFAVALNYMVVGFNPETFSH